MFGKEKQPKNTTESQEFDKLQSSGVDVKTSVERRIEAIRTRLNLQDIHPWSADDRTLQLLGWSSLGYITDKIAEIMADETRLINKKTNQPELPVVVNDFVQRLTTHSFEIETYLDAQDLNPDDPMTIDENTPFELDILDHMPEFPNYPISIDAGMSEYDKPYFQYPPGRFENRDVVITVDFVRALHAATVQIEADAYTLADTLSKHTSGKIKGIYSELYSYAQGYLLDEVAKRRLEKAEDYLRNGTGNVPDLTLSYAYHDICSALEASAKAYVALHCPAVLGPEWFPNRESTSD